MGREEPLNTYIVKLIRHKCCVFVPCDGLDVCPVYVRSVLSFVAFDVSVEHEKEYLQYQGCCRGTCAGGFKCWLDTDVLFLVTSSSGWFDSCWEWICLPQVVILAACVTFICRECKGEAHEPCDCEIWKLWLQKVTEMRPEECKY